MSFAPRNGESSAAGSSRETSAKHPEQGLRQTPISSFTSVRTNNSQGFEPGPTSRRHRTTGGQSISSLVDLEELEFSVEQSFDFETPTSGQGQRAGDEDRLAAGELEGPSISQSVDDTHGFESSKTHFIYPDNQHDQWTSWWEKTPGFKAYSDKYGGKKRIRWDSTARGAEIWKFYRQCAVKSGKNLGHPNIECVLCGAILAHPATVGTTSMHDHNKSIGCKKTRQRNVAEHSSTPTLDELWKKGTKVSRFYTS
jgi:hypothetical protein